MSRGATRIMLSFANSRTQCGLVAWWFGGIRGNGGILNLGIQFGCSQYIDTLYLRTFIDSMHLYLSLHFWLYRYIYVSFPDTYILKKIPGKKTHPVLFIHLAVYLLYPTQWETGELTGKGRVVDSNEGWYLQGNWHIPPWEVRTTIFEGALRGEMLVPRRV